MVQLGPGHLFRDNLRETGGGQGVQLGPGHLSRDNLRETGGGQGVQLSPGHLWGKSTQYLQALQGAALHSLSDLQGRAYPIPREEFLPHP